MREQNTKTFLGSRYLGLNLFYVRELRLVLPRPEASSFSSIQWLLARVLGLWVSPWPVAMLLLCTPWHDVVQRQEQANCSLRRRLPVPTSSTPGRSVVSSISVSCNLGRGSAETNSDSLALISRYTMLPAPFCRPLVGNCSAILPAICSLKLIFFIRTFFSTTNRSEDNQRGATEI
jgi:hypothetical protein